LGPSQGKPLNEPGEVDCGVTMPLVEIKWWAGRDDATKAKTIEKVTDALCEACGCSREGVTVIIQDIPKTQWGRAGKPSA
jgi:4-oxalocrotonate tautomerase